MVYFQYHLNCQNIHDNKGDNEFYLMKSCHNTANACLYLKSHKFNLNRLFGCNQENDALFSISPQLSEYS